MADERDKQEPGASLGNAPLLGENFTEAKLTQVPLEQSTPTPTRPPITAAQQHDPIEALEQRPSGEAFNKQASNDTQSLPQSDAMQKVYADLRADQGLPPVGSQMVQAQEPTPSPSNTMPEAKAQDAQAFNTQWTDEQARAKAYQERLDAAFQQAKEEQGQDENEPSRDQGLSR